MEKELHERVKAALIKAIGDQSSGCNSDRCCCFGAEDVLDCKLGVTVDELTDAAIAAFQPQEVKPAMDNTIWAEDAAARRISALLALPLPENSDMLGIGGEFDPWSIFPAIYGTYSSSFDKCAIEVLEELRNHNRRRHDLGADMIREMLCVSDLCNYGSSPRVCFPTPQFEKLLPALIEKWRAYATISWGDAWDQDRRGR